MAKDVIGEDAKTKAANLKNGEVMLLENVRFHKEETDIDEIDYEYTVCLRLLNSRYTPSKADKLKCQGYLYRKGFNYSAIRLAIEDFFFNP